jgi:hypothetical protein
VPYRTPVLRLRHGALTLLICSGAACGEGLLSARALEFDAGVTDRPAILDVRPQVSIVEGGVGLDGHGGADAATTGQAADASVLADARPVVPDAAPDLAPDTGPPAETCMVVPPTLDEKIVLSLVGVRLEVPSNTLRKLVPSEVCLRQVPPRRGSVAGPAYDVYVQGGIFAESPRLIVDFAAPAGMPASRIFVLGYLGEMGTWLITDGAKDSRDPSGKLSGNIISRAFSKDFVAHLAPVVLCTGALPMCTCSGGVCQSFSMGP